MLILSSADIFQNYFFQNNSFRNTIRVSSILDSDQDQHFGGPDLGLNRLQRLSADNKLMLADKELKGLYCIFICDGPCWKFLFVLIFMSQSTIFQLYQDGSSWVEPGLSKD